MTGNVRQARRQQKGDRRLLSCRSDCHDFRQFQDFLVQKCVKPIQTDTPKLIRNLAKKAKFMSKNRRKSDEILRINRKNALTFFLIDSELTQVFNST